MKKARLLVLNPSERKIYEAECGELNDYYKHLECGCFDITRRKIGGKPYDIFCDDIGLYAEDPWISAVNEAGDEVMLVGNLIFSNTDSEGNTISLSDDDIKNIKSNIAHYTTASGRVGIAVMCEY